MIVQYSFRLHRHTMYVDAIYCCLLLVSLSVTVVSSAKMVEDAVWVVGLGGLSSKNQALDGV